MKPTFLISFKIFWSIVWRAIIASIFAYGVVIGICFLALMLLFGFDAVISGFPHLEMGIQILIVASAIVAIVLIQLFVMKWVFNCLPEVEYREAKVIFMKHANVVEQFSVFDVICVWWSITWRAFVIMIPFLLFYFIIIQNYFGMCFNMQMSIPSVEIAEFILQIIALFVDILAIKWMLFTKYTGRWIRLEPRQMVSGVE